jgi:hypothetical protein
MLRTGMVVLICALMIHEARAQTDKSTIRGSVVDQSRAVVPKAEITLTDVGTNSVVRIVASDENGNYELSDLKPGLYRLKADAAGFRSYVAEDVRLDTAQIRRVDITFQVGTTAESITVEAGVAVLTTETGTIGGTVEKEKLQDSPSVNVIPSPFAMLTTIPGIQGSGWSVRVAGQSSQQLSQAMDGVENDRYGGANISFNDEVQISMVNATAENSRVASYNMTSKRGENNFHGMVYYKHFNSGLNARNFFDPVRIPFIQHEWQGEASGPVWKDKTFFYASWFSQKIPLGTYKNATVASVPMRRGDFSQFGAANQVIQDPLTAADAAGNRTPFPGQIIPLSRHNDIARKVLDNFLPEPNQGNPSVFSTNNFGFLHPFHYDYFKTNSVQWRLDHNVSAKNTVYIRWRHGWTPYVLDRNLPKFTWTRYRDQGQWIVSDTHVISPSIVNTFRFGRSPNKITDGDTQAGVTPLNGAESVKLLGLQGVNRGNYSAQGFPVMNITGLQPLQTIAGGLLADDMDYTFEDSVTWTKGRHVLKAGGEFRTFRSFVGTIPDGTFGSFAFNGAMTRSQIGFADFLLGIPQSSTRLDPFTKRTRTNKETGLFITDSFKATSRLTLDLGVRYDYYSLPTFTDGLMFNWDRATNTVNVTPEGAGRIHALYPKNIKIGNGPVVPNPDRRDIRPRLSGAYRLTDKLVFRGGYGAFTERIDYFARILSGGPFQIAENYQNVIAPAGGALFQFPNPFPQSLASAGIPSQSITGFPIDTRTGTIHQFNFTIEREWQGIGFRTSYVGSRGKGIIYNIGINKPQPGLTAFTQARRPYPEFIGVTEARNDGQTKYDALQIQAQKRMGDFQFNAHWTLSNSLANYLVTENPYAVIDRWSRQAGDRRHYAVITGTWKVPLGRGRRYLNSSSSALNHAVGGWTFNTISYLTSGFFFSPSFSGSDPSNTNTVGGLPDRIADGNLPGDRRTYAQWFDPSAFRVPAPGTFGNSSANVLVGQGINVHHMSLMKRFRITERFSTILTGMVSNTFNSPHFVEPPANISVPATVGRFATSVSDFDAEKHIGRRMALMLRLEF